MVTCYVYYSFGKIYEKIGLNYNLKYDIVKRIKNRKNGRKQKNVKKRTNG